MYNNCAVRRSVKRHGHTRFIPTAYALLLTASLFFFYETVEWPQGKKQSPSAFSKLRTQSSKALKSYQGPQPIGFAKTAAAQEPIAPPPIFLWIDYKQNLRVWPVVASDAIRSPPDPA